MIAPLNYVLHYVPQGLAGVAVTFIMLRELYPFRRPYAPVLWWSFFLVKAIGESYLYYALAFGGAGTWLESFMIVWTSVCGIGAFLVVYQTFDEELVPIEACAVVCDMCASLCTSLGLITSSAVSGMPLDTGYVRPFGPWTIVCVVMTMVAALSIRPLILSLLRWLRQIVKRNRLVWGAAAFALIAMAVGITQKLGVSVSVNNQTASVVPFVVTVMVGVAALLLVRGRNVHRRERAVRECAALAASYDATIRTQLSALEGELSVLEGNDRVLMALEPGESEEVAEVRRLEKTYRRLCAGVYCNRPALDAVLTAGALRLRGMGVEPSLTVAGVPEQAVVPPTVVLALLNIACEAAERVDRIEREAVELRVRGVGDQVLFRLSVPQRWGALWARRTLMSFDVNDTMLVREHKRDGRTVVLVVDKGVAA